MDRTMSLVLYKDGNRKARLLSYEEAYEEYVDAFLSRLTGCELTLEFVSFYRYQMARYLRSKPVFTLSLPEGDMISDLIRDAYDSFLSALESSPFNVTGVSAFRGKVTLTRSPMHSEGHNVPFFSEFSFVGS